MIYLLDWRLWAVAALLALGPIGYVKGRSDGRKLERASVAAATAQADREARALERRRQDRADEAGRLAAAREDRLRAAADGARGELGGLRDTLDTVERASKESGDAARASVAALSAVFADCSRRYQGLAEVADRHASDSLMLQEAWPR